MSNGNGASNIRASTQFLETKKERYAYRRFGDGPGLPLLFLQHFTGTLDNWDSAVTDPLCDRERSHFVRKRGPGAFQREGAGNRGGHGEHALAFVDGLGLKICDVLGFSLGGMVAQQMALDRPSIFRRLILVGTAPRGGELIMHLDRPILAKPLADRTLKGYAVLQKICRRGRGNPPGSLSEYDAQLGRESKDHARREKKMAVAKIEVQRFSVISSKPFENVIETLKGLVGRLNVGELTKSSKSAGSFADLEKLIGQNMGSTGLMLFEELDHGAVLRKESGLDKPKILRLLIGNPLVMKEMAKHVPDAGSYAPTTVLVDERADGVHLSYDRMTSFLARYGNAKALAVARDLDSKIETLLLESAG